MPGLPKIAPIKKGLSFKFILYIFSSISLIFAIIFLYNFTISKNIVEKNLRTNAKNMIERGVTQIENILLPFQNIPDNYSRIIENTDFSKESMIRILKQELLSNPEIYGAAIAMEPYFFSDSEEYFMAYYSRAGDSITLQYLLDGQYDYFTMDWYQIPRELNQPDWSEPYFDDGAGDIIMATYSVPLYREVEGEKQFVGILTADISLTWLEEFVNGIKILETGYGFVVTKNGTIACHPVKDIMLNETIFSVAETQNSQQLRDIGKNMIRGEESFAEMEYRNISTNKLSWIAYAPISLNGWSFGIVFPVDEFMADINNLFTDVLVLYISGLIIILTIVILISRSITKPLRSFTQASKKIAQGNFEVELPDINTKDEMKELHDSFVYMQERLAEYIVNLRETTSAREKIESELRIAREIQLGMIPHMFPPFPELSQIDLFAVLRPAKEVGGDLYDFFLLDEDKLCFAIGDVSGKGVPASLFMAVTRTLLRSVADKGKSTETWVSSLNKSLSYNNESSMFVTFFVGVLNVRNGLLTYTNAGHNPPVIIRNNGEVKMMELASSIPVGIFGDMNFTESSIHMEKGDKLFLYTDGVTEAEDCSMCLYSEDRLLTTLKKNNQVMPETLIHSVEKDLINHVSNNPQSDDITMMAIVYNG